LQEQESKYSFEVIVVDDGSKTELDLSHLQTVPGIRLVRMEAGGAAKARNAGWRVAKGDIAIFLDCDQIVDRHFIQNHCRPFFSHPDQRLAQIGERRRLGKDQRPALSSMADATVEARNELFSILSFNLQSIECSWHLYYTHNASVRRRDLEAIGGFDEGFRGWGLEDCELGYRLHKAGVQIVYNPLVTALHQFHDETFHQDKFQGWVRNLEYFESKHPGFEVRAQRILGDFFDPVTREKTHTDWLGRMLLMESVMRLVHPKDRAVRQSMARRVADREDLMRVPMQNPKVVVSLRRDQLDLAIEIQTSHACQHVFLTFE
jgi:GT2 family glycosyltransferase